MQTAVLPAAFERVLRSWDETSAPAAVRARAALGPLLADAWEGIDVHGASQSTLTQTGSPFEPAFSLAAPGLRYTVDPSPPGLDMRLRLRHALDLLSALGAPAASAGLIDRLEPLQAHGELRYGAQIGARHSASSDRYKLYIELPQAAQVQAAAWAADVLGGAPAPGGYGRAARPTLAGLDLSSGQIEVYYRIEQLHPHDIGSLMEGANLAERAGEVRAMLSATQPVPIRDALPGATWGYSYALEPGQRVVFSIYTFARTLFGPDGWIRAGLLAMGRRHGWDLSSYEHISSPLAGHRGILCHHGLVGLVVPPDRPAAAWIGLAPPPVPT